MKIKTSKLTGAALDWAVAMIEFPDEPRGNLERCTGRCGEEYEHRYSTNWAQGGPIIERDKITVSQGRDLIASIWDPNGILGNSDWYRFKQRGSTPLIAAMRCYVASKLGDEVEVPDELA
jgi:hypothetical protein